MGRELIACAPIWAGMSRRRFDVRLEEPMRPSQREPRVWTESGSMELFDYPDTAKCTELPLLAFCLAKYVDTHARMFFDADLVRGRNVHWG